MKGILLVSHGKMAEGMVDSASMFYGDDIKQFASLCLSPMDNPEEFGGRIKEVVETIDSGDGVIVFADLFGGTPCNQSIMQLNDNIELVSGLNFPMLLDVLGSREFSDVEASHLVEVGKEGIADVKKMLNELSSQDDE